jgi:hypothetical protein
VTAEGGLECPEPPVPEGAQPTSHPQVANTKVDAIRHGFMWLSYFRFFRSDTVPIKALIGNLPSMFGLADLSGTVACFAVSVWCDLC